LLCIWSRKAMASAASLSSFEGHSMSPFHTCSGYCGLHVSAEGGEYVPDHVQWLAKHLVAHGLCVLFELLRSRHDECGRALVPHRRVHSDDGFEELPRRGEAAETGVWSQ
jgi:hypothetical protein